MKDDTYYKRDNTGKKFITAFQLFKIQNNKIDKLITPIVVNIITYEHIIL